MKVTKVKVENVSKESPKKSVHYPSFQQQFRTREDIASLEQAIDSAINLDNHDRQDLIRIYDRVLEDPKLYSQWETRKMKTISKEFKVVKKGDNEELEQTNLFETEWFLQFVNAILDSKLYGYTFGEFGAYEDDKFIDWKDDKGIWRDAFHVIRRDYIKPELGIIIRNPSDTVGVPMSDSVWGVYVGNRKPDEILRKIAKYSLFKDNVLSNWSEWAEVFGMDIMIGKTTAEGSDRNRFKKALENIGASGKGVIDEDDTIEFAGTSKSDAFKVYKEFAEYIDGQISNVIFGQDVVSNNTGQVVGNVGENISNLYGDADAKFLARIINGKLFPLLTNIGFANMTGLEFVYDDTEQISMSQKAERDLKISQMGNRLTKEYIEETYGVLIDDSLEGTPVKDIQKSIENLYNVSAQ